MRGSNRENVGSGLVNFGVRWRNRHRRQCSCSRSDRERTDGLNDVRVVVGGNGERGGGSDACGVDEVGDLEHHYGVLGKVVARGHSASHFDGHRGEKRRGLLCLRRSSLRT